MFIKTVIAVLATTLAARLVQRLSRNNQERRLRDDHRRQREALNRWEDEGGNLPATPQR
jgi:hypothetical protein